MDGKNPKRQRTALEDRTNVAESTTQPAPAYHIIVKKNGNVQLRPGTNDLSCLSSVGEDDPASLIFWSVPMVTAAVNDLNQQQHPPGAAAGWLGAYPITADGLQMAIMNKIRHDLGDVGHLVGYGLISELSLANWGRVNQVLALLPQDPLLQAIQVNHLPLGSHYLLADRQRRTTAVRVPLILPEGGHAIID